MAIDPQCAAIVYEATSWVLARVMSLPVQRQRVQAWDEYPELLQYEQRLEQACHEGKVDATREAARQYCTVWRRIILRRLTDDAPTITVGNIEVSSPRGTLLDYGTDITIKDGETLTSEFNVSSE